MFKKIKKQLIPIIVFVPIDVRRLFRDKVAIFFVFLFPLIFLLVFGSIFKSSGDISFKVGLINNSKTEFSATFIQDLKKSGVIEVDESIMTSDQANEKMARGEVDATVILPPNFGETGKNKYPTGQLEIIYDQNNESSGQSLASVMEGIFQDINSQYVETYSPFTVTASSTATKGLSRFDYTFSGLMGFTLLSMGIFGPTQVFPRLKQRGVLRRYSTTTLKVWQYFVGNVISNGVAGVLASSLMFVAALTLFDLEMRGDYLSLLAVVVIGVTMLFGIGLALGGWAKNENQAAPLSQLVTLPMLFLSGVFFPTFLMPDWLQSITRFIPLTPVIESIRLVVTEGQTLFNLGDQMVIILPWTAAIYLIAFRVFRWE
jgi:ABC-2 type transport system permease protein